MKSLLVTVQSLAGWHLRRELRDMLQAPADTVTDAQEKRARLKVHGRGTKICRQSSTV